jgi:hypothetical protein
MFANRGDENIKNVFNNTQNNLETKYRRKETDSLRIAMPAATKIMTSNEIKSRAKDFSTRLSLFDTGTDAYLRPDNSLMSISLPSSTIEKSYCNVDWTVTPIG